MPRRVGLRVSACASALLAACADDPPQSAVETPRPLIDLARFEPLSEADDPLREHRPAVIECSALTGWFVEDDYLELDTGRCNYVALAQPALAGAASGQRLEGRLSHFDLTAEAPGEAHFALWIDENAVWERSVAVPGAAGVYSFAVELPRGFEPGARVMLHLHNHGQNTWQFFPLQVTAASR